jgi:hypothetical protein
MNATDKPQTPAEAAEAELRRWNQERREKDEAKRKEAKPLRFHIRVVMPGGINE